MDSPAVGDRLAEGDSSVGESRSGRVGCRRS